MIWIYLCIGIRCSTRRNYTELNGIIDEAKNNETIINSMFETIKAESGIELELYDLNKQQKNASFKTVKNIGLNKPFIKGTTLVQLIMQ